MRVENVEQGITDVQGISVEELIGGVAPVKEAPTIEEPKNSNQGVEIKNDNTSNDSQDTGLDFKGLVGDVNVEVPKLETDTKEKSDDVVELKSDTGQVLDYKSTLSDLMERGLVTKFDTIETENGEVSFDNLEVDKDTFFEIIQQSISDSREELLKDMVSVKDISQLTKDIIDAEKNGASVNDVIRFYTTYERPLDMIDLSTLDGQKMAVSLYMGTKNLSSDEIEDYVQGLVTTNKLEETSEKMYNELKVAVNKYKEQEKQKAEQLRQEQIALERKFKTELTAELKTFDLNDKYIKKIVDTATSVNEDGVKGIDKLFNDYLSDPKKAKELVLFLFDNEEYKKQTSRELLREKDISTMRKMSLVRKNRGQSDIVDSDKEVSKAGIDISKL